MSAIVTQQMIYDELQKIRKDLNYLLTRDIENNVEEISLYRAAKRIRKSPDYLKSEADRGNLKAIITNSNNKKRYRFRVCDLYEWQKNRMNNTLRIWEQEDTMPADNSEEWAKNFTENFHKQNKKVHHYARTNTD